MNMKRLRSAMNPALKARLLRILDGAQLFFICSWPLLLIKTDAFISIYIICSMAAVLAFLFNRKCCEQTPKNVPIITSLVSCLFSALIVLANYRVFLPVRENLFEIIAAFIGGFIVAKNILLWLYCHLPAKETKNVVRPAHASTIVFLIAFCTLSIIYLLHLFFSAYPGLLTYDSFLQVKQSLNGITSNHHPFWHTIIIKGILSVGIRLFGDINAAVALYSVCQLLFVAAAVAFSLATLCSAGVRKRYIFLCGLPFAVLPYHILYSVTMWKDVVFAVAALFYVVFFFRCLKKIGNFAVNTIFLFVFTVLFCVWRTNAWFAMVPSVFLLFILLQKKHIKLVLVMAAAVVVAWGMRSPVLSALEVKQPDFVESISIPVQQVARVIVDDGYISEEDIDALNRIMDVDEVKDLYLDYISDPIKIEILRKGQAHLVANKLEYLKLWIRVGIDNPSSYIKAWVDQTKGYYNSGYTYWITAAHKSNVDLGIEAKVFDNPINDFFLNATKKMTEMTLAQPVISIGFCTWILGAFTVVLFLRRREETALAIPLLMVIATLLIASPVFSEFRYAYFMFMTLPFLIVVSMHKFDNSEGENKKWIKLLF